MDIENEEQLYNMTLEAFDELRRAHPVFERVITESELQYDERALNNRKLYLLGETHHSPKPLDKVHEDLYPIIRENPKEWLFLLEDAEYRKGLVSTEPRAYPLRFYLYGLSSLHDIQVDEALASLNSPDVREHLREKAGITEEDIDRCILTGTILDYLSPDDPDFIENFISIMTMTTKHLPKQLQLEYAYKLISKTIQEGSEAFYELGDRITKHWNDYSKQEFHKTLERHPDKSDILISAGIAHLPVFQ